MASYSYQPPDSQLVAAALSAAFHRPVVTQEVYQRRKHELQFARVETLDLQRLADLSYEPATGKYGNVFGESGRKITVYMQSLSGRRIELDVGEDSYAEELKYLLEEKEEVLIDNDRFVLLHNGKRMEDGRRISEYGVEDCDVIEFTAKLFASGPMPLVLDDNFRDPLFDFDFSDMTDDGTAFMRGGYCYKRPYGWKRIALKVYGMYEDNIWLGEGGYRTDSSTGEWPVSYHGTADRNVNSIAQVGYKLSCRKRDIYDAKGIYSSPSIQVAEFFAESFAHYGKYYKVVFQNRVTTEGLKFCPGEYWAQTNEKGIRPYGLCIKKV